MSLAEELSIADAPRPFKIDSTQRKNGAASGSASRRNKPLKQILSSERDAHMARLGLADTKKAKRKSGDAPSASPNPKSRRVTSSSSVWGAPEQPTSAESVAGPADEEPAVSHSTGSGKHRIDFPTCAYELIV